MQISNYPDESTVRNDSLPFTTPEPANSERISYRVLIVDDDALVRGSLAAVLEIEGFEVLEASNGREAVINAVQYSPDLILLDLNMPNMDGWTAFAKLNDARPFIPVIVITARPHQYKQAMGLGVDAFMEKPLNIAALLQAIKSLISEDENGRARRVTDPSFVTRLLKHD
jgi:DNA-binding response OmpR family regulator